jgi:hypothetical protein
MRPRARGAILPAAPAPGLSLRAKYHTDTPFSRTLTVASFEPAATVQRPISGVSLAANRLEYPESEWQP